MSEDDSEDQFEAVSFIFGLVIAVVVVVLITLGYRLGRYNAESDMESKIICVAEEVTE